MRLGVLSPHLPCLQRSDNSKEKDPVGKSTAKSLVNSETINAFVARFWSLEMGEAGGAGAGGCLCWGGCAGSDRVQGWSWGQLIAPQATFGAGKEGSWLGIER